MARSSSGKKQQWQSVAVARSSSGTVAVAISSSGKVVEARSERHAAQPDGEIDCSGRYIYTEIHMHCGAP